jgi:hypothetical protein
MRTTFFLDLKFYVNPMIIPQKNFPCGALAKGKQKLYLNLMTIPQKKFPCRALAKGKQTNYI